MCVHEIDEYDKLILRRKNCCFYMRVIEMKVTEERKKIIIKRYCFYSGV